VAPAVDRHLKERGSIVAEEEALAGGMVNPGAVLRRGDLVERPAPCAAICAR
jgi:hypothetical protein